MLVMIRKIFKNMLLKDAQDEISKNRDAVNEEAVINSRCSQLTIKYKKASIRKIEFVQYPSIHAASSIGSCVASRKSSSKSSSAFPRKIYK
jgi:hypothetical protein